MRVVDAHAHLDPRVLDLPAMVARMDRHGVDQAILIPTMNDPLPETPAGLLRAFRACLCSFAWPVAGWIEKSFHDADGNLRLRGQTVRIFARPDNGVVAAALAARPDRFLGWIFLNPAVGGDPRDELERWRQVPGFVGVKLHPHWHRWPLRDALPLAKRCEELGLPILVHLGFGPGGDYRAITEACPRLTMVFAHGGIPHFQRMWDDVRRSDRLFVDVSSPYLSERLVRRMAAVLGPERLLYGTDAPYGSHEADGTYDYGHIKGWVERLAVPAVGVEQVLGGNVLALIDRATVRGR